MKFLKKFENKFKEGDFVHIEDWNDAKILKVYNDECLVEFEDGYSTIINNDELSLFTSDEINYMKELNIEKKFNL